MGSLIDALFNAERVCLDTAPIIYYVEDNPTFVDIIAPVIGTIERGEKKCVCSVITLTEVLVKPLETKQIELAKKYRDLLTSCPHLDFHPVDQRIAEEAARIRAVYKFRIADAIQLATAMIAGADAFVTNDVKLDRFPEVRVYVLSKFIESRLF